MSDDKYFRNVMLLILGFYLILYGIMLYSDDCQNEQAFKHGKKSYLSGVDPFSNPFAGSKYTERSKRWLDGWISESDKKRQIEYDHKSKANGQP